MKLEGLVKYFLGMYCSLISAYFGQTRMKWTSVSTSLLQKGQKELAGVASLQERSLCVLSGDTSSLNLIKKFLALVCFKPVLNWAMFLREPSWKYSAKLAGS